MIAEYKGKAYKIVKDGKNWELISKNPQSVEEGFIKDGKMFYMSISDLSMLDGAYDIWMIVEFDTQLEKVPKEWRLEITKEFLKDKSVKLIFGEGLLPNWDVEDKNVCSKYIKISELTAAYVVKRNLINNEVERKAIQINSFEEEFNKFLCI